MALITAILIGFLAIIIPGFFLALALLKKTKFSLFEIIIIGFILGMIVPPMAVWLESYLIPYSSAFSFSANLYNINIAVITIIGIVVSFQQGAFKGIFSGQALQMGKPSTMKEVDADYKKRISEMRSTISRLGVDLKLIKQHQKEEDDLATRHQDEMALLHDAGPEEKAKVLELHNGQERKLYEQHEHEEGMLINNATSRIQPQKMGIKWVFALLMLIMIVTFTTRFASISVAPNYFEFDPYFDMVSTQYILTYGYQLYLDHSAWPVVTAGTNHRAEPLIPYLEAYWYDIAGPQPQTTLGGVVPIPTNLANTPPNTNLLSLVSSYYPPLAAAMLVFVVFLLLYHIYGEFPAIIGAILAAAMPTLITTFIAGEQLLEPFGIMLLFFFFATYLIAVENPKDPRYAILAGLAFAANFLGAQYYTVPTGILAIYIVAQGLFNVIKGKPMGDFYKMNVIVLIIITVIFALYNPYAATLQNRIPSYFGVPIIVSFPLLALLLVALFQGIPMLLKKFKAGVTKLSTELYVIWFFIIVVALILLILFTPLGSPVKAYLSLSSHFTHPSTPLFMTVQEYAPTGLNFNFGVNGFGIIGTNLFTGLVSGGVSLIIWPVLILFVILEIYAIVYKNSQTGIMMLAFVIPLAVAGMSEVKYLPHFGVAYIIAIGVIIGEVMVWLKLKPEEIKRPTNFLYIFTALIIVIALIAAAAINSYPSVATDAVAIPCLIALVIGMALYVTKNPEVLAKHLSVAAGAIIAFIIVAGLLALLGTPLGVAVILGIAIAVGILCLGMVHYLNASTNYKYFLTMFLFILLVVFAELAPSLTQVFQATFNQDCTAIADGDNVIGDGLFCNTVPAYWLQATAWMRENVGPYAPRILSWWDYGDWINWFGNSNAVIRGDNSVAQEDYDTAARYVLGQSDGYGPSNLSSYMETIQTKYVLFDDQLIPKWGALDFLACIDTGQTSQNYTYSQGKAYNQSFILGTSPCEISHSPAQLLVPINISSVNAYCSFSNSTSTALQSIVVIGSPIPQVANQTYCLPTAFLNDFPNGAPTALLYPNGTKSNAFVTMDLYQGLLNAGGGQQFAEFTLLYLPNGPNDTITDAPSEFYDSNYYRGYFLGKLPGFTLAYPKNFSGVNYINVTDKIMIYAVNNYTGSLPTVIPKPNYTTNNYSMPG